VPALCAALAQLEPGVSKHSGQARAHVGCRIGLHPLSPKVQLSCWSSVTAPVPYDPYRPQHNGLPRRSVPYVRFWAEDPL